MHRDVNILEAIRVTQVLLKVLHVLHQQLPRTFEVSVYFVVFVAHVDHDYIRRSATR